jgi:polyisoprenoid-binding protein YceI
MPTTTTTTALDQLTGTYTVDPGHSRLGFVACHAMVAKVRGQFNEFTGSVRADGTDPERSSVELSIEGASIDTGDESRDVHLRSGDFLALDDHPTISFRSSGLQPLSEHLYRVSSDLAIRGVTRSVEIDVDYLGSAVDPLDNRRIAFEGSIEINRRDWGVSWNAALEAGGVLVSEKVVLDIEIAAIRDS